MPAATTAATKRKPATAKSSPASRPSATTKSPKAPRARVSLAEAMRELEKSGSAQNRKTYTRHGAAEPMFGVSFATLKAMTKRIDVDHELALALWSTGNFDARNLAVKIVDPARIASADLDRWARETCTARICGGYVGSVAAESPHGATKVAQWLASKDASVRDTGWSLLGQLALRDETAADAFFGDRLVDIETTIQNAPSFERAAMNQAMIAIGLRNATLRKTAIAAAKRIGPVDVDHGDTACKTPAAVESIDKAWAHATTKGFASPAAQERNRETPRRRC